MSVIALTTRLSITSAEAATPKSARQTISGAVKDALGRPMSGVGLALQNRAGKVTMKLRSGADGRFTFSNVTPGVYAIVAQKSSFKTATAIVTVTSRGGKTIEIALESEAALSMQVVAKRLDKSRNGLSPETGGSVYRFNETTLQELPHGNNTSLNQVLLQAPGVVQDSYGHLHVRGDHANLQYRINGCFRRVSPDSAKC